MKALHFFREIFSFPWREEVHLKSILEAFKRLQSSTFEETLGDDVHAPRMAYNAFGRNVSHLNTECSGES